MGLEEWVPMAALVLCALSLTATTTAEVHFGIEATDDELDTLSRREGRRLRHIDFFEALEHGGLLDKMRKGAREFGSSYRLTVNRAHDVHESSRPVPSFLQLPPELLDATFKQAENDWLTRERRIEHLWRKNVGADAHSAIGTAYAHTAPTPDAVALSNTSILLELATRDLMKNLYALESLAGADEEDEKQRSKRQSIHYDYEKMPDSFMRRQMRRQSNDLAGFDVGSFVRGSPQLSPGHCYSLEEQMPCDPNARYRTFSGYCNNLRNPLWGKSLTTFDRMLPNSYQDGVYLPRSTSVLKAPLPSPRHISQTIHVDVSHLSPRHTLMLMQFGQFMDHDVTHTPVNRGPGEAILNCRDCESYRHTHPECWPIEVPTGDRYYPQKNISNGRPYCIPFTRSLAGQQRLGPREQINQNTAYLDASHIYGETECKSNHLRAAMGKLNATYYPGRSGKDLMPQISHMRECKSASGYCFQAGDPRASEQPALTSLHTIFLRLHNHMTDQLHGVNPHWHEDRLYLEARRVIGAMFQHIVYNEWVPRVLGPKLINAYGLGLQTDGYYMGYDANCPASIFNEFSSAAMRFGHSLVRPHLARVDHRYNGVAPHINLRDGFFNSDMMMAPTMVDEIIRGLVSEPMENVDPFVTNEVTNHLFEDKRKEFSGLDLIATNIHRGRDHGLQGYNQYRGVCDLKKATSFQDLRSEIPTEVIVRLEHVYKHVDDIDLFTGALSERPVPGGLLGPTLSCIIGTQFKRLRQCDRFWYETNDPAIRFTEHQLAEIRKTTLAKILCDNMDQPSEIQKMVFDAPHNMLNPRIPCERLPRWNPDAWREGPGMDNRIPPIVSLSSPSMEHIPSPTRCSIGGRQLDVGESALPSPCVSCICAPEGAKCASLRILNCQRLFEEAHHDEIRKDKICVRQCGYLLNKHGLSRSFSIFPQSSRASAPTSK